MIYAPKNIFRERFCYLLIFFSCFFFFFFFFFFFCFCIATVQLWLRPPHFWCFLTAHNLNPTLVRTPLIEWSARRRDRYLHNTMDTIEEYSRCQGDSNRRSQQLRPCGHQDQHLLMLVIVNKLKIVEANWSVIWR